MRISDWSSDVCSSDLALARKTGDATLLVAAARGAESFQAGDIMIAEARRMDPELPFVWWDMQRIKPPRISGITPAERLKLLRVELADIEKFRSLYRAHPPTHFFFIPQYPDRKSTRLNSSH